MPETIVTIDDMRKRVAATRSRSATIGLVPTMGALHDGHLSLMRRAREDCDSVVVSIFVNPAQFGLDEDFDKYPRVMERDLELCGETGVDLVFAPAASEMYPDAFATYVSPEDSLALKLCGVNRPGHFRGVDTVVLKLLNICTPDFAYFGQKDYQQSVIIRRMIEDLNLDIGVVICPTVRETDGLAMSSRNAYLNSEERAQATCLYRALLAARQAVEDEKISDALVVKTRMVDIIDEAPAARIDYVEFVDPESLESLKRLNGKVVVALAVQIGPARLIDNMVLNAS